MRGRELVVKTCFDTHSGLLDFRNVVEFRKSIKQFYAQDAANQKIVAEKVGAHCVF